MKRISKHLIIKIVRKKVISNQIKKIFRIRKTIATMMMIINNKNIKIEMTIAIK
jgi:hypothetical protein